MDHPEHGCFNTYFYPQFVNSGSSSVIHGNATTCQVVLAIVANILSGFVSIIGIIIMGIEFPAFESLGNKYIWSNMAGMMLLQISAACTISEMILAIIVAHWFRRVPERWLRGPNSHVKERWVWWQVSVTLPGGQSWMVSRKLKHQVSSSVRRDLCKMNNQANKVESNMPTSTSGPHRSLKRNREKPLTKARNFIGSR
uniref:Uncharacterized protein n=1 Tax=Peromyscus maniculatus bairdii TaxID=230844 RepID=A0A8C8UDE8_PERMB